MNTDKFSIITSYAWVENPETNEGKFHFHQDVFHKDPAILSLRSKKYLCGLEVIDFKALIDYDWMQMARDNHEPHEDRFCIVCWEKYKLNKP